MPLHPPDPFRYVSTAAARARSVPAPGRTAAATLREEWDALADRVGATPFERPGWIDAWHRGYGRGALEVLTVRDGGELAGVLPLLVSRRLVSSPTNSHTPLFGPVADGRATERLLAWELLQHAPRGFRLEHVDPDSGWFRELRDALAKSRWRALVTTTARPPYVRIRGGWEGYVAGLSRNLVKQLGRRRRRLEEAGSVAFELRTTELGLDAAMDDFVALEASGWKAAAGTAIASRDESVAFYRELAGWAAARGALRLAFLRHEGRAIAAELALGLGGVAYSLKGGFDPDYRRFGPGQLLTFEMLRRAFEDGLESYELLGTDDAYKLAWTDRTRERVRIEAFPPGVRGALRHGARRRLRAIRARLRRG